MPDVPDEDFALRLEGGGISIEKTVNKQVAMAIVAAVLSEGATAARLEPEANERLRAQPAVSLHEFLNNAANNAEKITRLGHYICHYEGKETFSKNDIIEGFRRAREAIPRNLSRDIGSAIKLGLIAEASGKARLYYITHKGVQLIDTKFRRSE